MELFDTALRIDAPGPSGVPVVNNLKLIRDSARFLLGRVGPFEQPVVPATAGNGSVVVVRGREAVKQVFTDTAAFQRADGFFDLPPGRPWSGMFDAVITANGAEHTRRRKLLMPAVHRTAMTHYRAVFADTFERSRFAAVDDAPFDLKRECLRISKANLMRCLLGLDDADGLSAFADRIVTLGTEAGDPRVLLFKRDLRWSPYGRWLRRVARAYDQLATLIAQRRAGEPRPDALSILCHAVDEDGDQLTTEEIAGELHGFFAAGFETTAMTMSLALITLLGSPDPDAAPVDPSTVDVDAVVKESQRLLPAVPITLPRRVTATVEVAGSPPVPKGALLFLSPLLEHRNPAVYPQPQVFRPQRWTAGEPGPKQYEFIPFGLGPRRCLGAEFADLQVRTTLTLLLERGLPGLVEPRIDYGMVNGVTAGPRRPVPVRAGGPKWTVLTGSVTRVWKPAA
ncbi:cytochrome P450 [Dactylosporangium siamense]|uniref:Cytochrome P450 n=1 Tax=Dactylosporangium siamense TaxID=685454 RepID=A0A919PSQ7_9ACTN|nr:cytochrome P450 [Dactylosporangium siamense]GIG50190.1 cytochrome P450 [Dactylosporangium siamense]